MFATLRKPHALLGAGLVLLLLVAATQLAPKAAARLSGVAPAPEIPGARADTQRVTVPVRLETPGGPAAAPAGDASPSGSRGRATVAVRRGTIDEQLSLLGRVAAPEDVPLSFAAPGRVNILAVKPGQAVEPGQLLIQADSKDTERELTAARSRLDLSSTRADQLKAQIQTQQRQGAQRVEADRVRRQAAIADAAAALQRALDDQARTQTGAPAADRQTAAASVVSARANLDRAEAELARLTSGPNPSDVRAAEQQVAAATATLQRAESTRGPAAPPPASADRGALERELAAAQAALDRARAELDRQTRGPDPAELQSAQRDLEQAQAAYDATRSGQDAAASHSGTSEAASLLASRATAATNAAEAVQAARDRLAKLQASPGPNDVNVARRNVRVAEQAVDVARSRLESSQRGPEPVTAESANPAADLARAALATAEAHLREVQKGPAPEQVTAARSAVDIARAALDSANARVDQLNSPNSTALQDADSRVAAARAAVERARTENADSAGDDVDLRTYDLGLLDRTIAQDRAEVTKLETELVASRLVAPFAGTVTSIVVRSGDAFEPGRTVLTLAKPGEPIIRAGVTDDDVARLAVGQQALAQVNGSGAPVPTVLAAVVPNDDGGRSALFTTVWPDAPPALGTHIDLAVTVQQKQDVLLVPRRAVRSVGAQQYVEYMDGATRRRADVQVGIRSANEVEITQGIREGQMVLTGP